MRKTERQLAAEALLRVEAGGYSNLVLDGLAESPGLSPKDKAFAFALVYGVLERMLTLDAIINRQLSRSPDSVQPEVRAILRTAVYQIYYMDSVPDRAAVFEAAQTAKSMQLVGAAGFINGVLRSVLREKDKSAALWDNTTPLQKRLSIQYSCSMEVTALLADNLGAEKAERFLEDALGAPPVFLRINTMKTDSQNLIRQAAENGMELTDCEFPGNCVRTDKISGLEANPLFRDGMFHLQDISSQTAVAVLDPQPGMSVLDVCAAPGGKSFTIAQQMRDLGSVLACDLHAGRLGLIRQGAARLGLKSIEVRQRDAAVPMDLPEFDRILCDVPCSGLGVIRRKPELKYKCIQNLADIQYKILETSSNYLKRTGRLVYSTCTVNRRENEQIVGRFLREHPEFVPAALPDRLAEFAASPGMVTLLPEHFGGDGFFIACMERRCG